MLLFVNLIRNRASLERVEGFFPSLCVHQRDRLMSGIDLLSDPVLDKQLYYCAVDEKQ